MGIYMQVKAWYNLFILFYCLFFAIFFLSYRTRLGGKPISLLLSPLITAVLFLCMSDSDSFSYARHTCALWCYGALI